MLRIMLILGLAGLQAACAWQPLPDGSHMARLSPEQLAQSSVTVSSEERERLRQLDAQILAEQDRVARQQAFLRALQEPYLQWQLEYGWGWHGPGCHRWDTWGFGGRCFWPY